MKFWEVGQSNSRMTVKSLKSCVVDDICGDHQRVGIVEHCSDNGWNGVVFQKDNIAVQPDKQRTTIHLPVSISR